MKKLTFLLLTALTGLTASAQTEKGSQWIGGSFALSHYKVEETSSPEFSVTGAYRKQNSYQVGPSYSYFVADKLSISGNVGYSHSHADQTYYNNPTLQVNDSNTEIITNGYFASLGLNKYFLYENKVGVRTGPSAQYSRSKSKITSDNDPENSDAESTAFNVGIYLDFVYFPVKKVGLVASLGSLAYSKSKYEGLNNTNKQTDVGLNFFNSSKTFSIFYIFGKK
jgi:hypothetical protein